MGFLAPFMLIGGAAAGIPIALHFFYRAHYRPVPWGAMKFLRLAVEQTSRRLRFQEIILLLLRILVMLLLAAALARPVTCSAVTAGKRGEAVDAVFVIDLSYSMNAREGAKSRLDMAKEAASRVIDDLPPNSTVISVPPRNSIDQLSAAPRPGCRECEPPKNHGANTARPIARANAAERRLTIMGPPPAF